MSADSSQNGSFRKQIEELSQQKAALKEENDHIIADREGLNSKIHSLEMEIANRQSTYELLYKEMENLRSQLEKVLIEKDVINKENRSLTASSIDLNSQSEQAKQQADIYSKENESLKIENESLKSENSNLNSTLNQQRESFQKEIAHTSQALNDFKEENIALKQSLEQLSAANNLIEEDINRLKEEKQSLISERDNYKDANQESLAKVTALTQKSIELQESLKSLTQENDNLKRDALQKKEDPGSSEFLVNENMALQSKIETLQAYVSFPIH